MPRIIVQALTRADKIGPRTLAERAIPTDQHSDHYLAQLIERVCWALRDAERLEARAITYRAKRRPRTPKRTDGHDAARVGSSSDRRPLDAGGASA